MKPKQNMKIIGDFNLNNQTSRLSFMTAFFIERGLVLTKSLQFLVYHNCFLLLLGLFCIELYNPEWNLGF